MTKIAGQDEEIYSHPKYPVKKSLSPDDLVVHGHNYQLRLNEQKAQLLCERLQYTIFCIYQPFLQFLFVKWVRMVFKKAIKSSNINWNWWIDMIMHKNRDKSLCGALELFFEHFLFCHFKGPFPKVDRYSRNWTVGRSENLWGVGVEISV